MGGDQVVVHVARMGGRVADAREAGDLGEPPAEFAEADRAAARVEAVIGVDVLPEQRELHHAGGDEVLGLREHLRDGRETSAPRV